MRIVKLFVPAGIRTQQRGQIPTFLEEGAGLTMVGDAVGVTIAAPYGTFVVPWAQVQTARLADVTPTAVTEPRKVGKHGR